MAFNLTPTALIANTVLGVDLLTNPLNRDVVGVFNQETLEQVFIAARPVKAFVRETSRVMNHPVETGVTLSDHHVIDPKTIELAMMIKSDFYSSAYEQMRGAFINATLLSVQTKAGVYPNMIIQELPHEEDPDLFDIITVGLRLREVLFVAPSSITQAQNNINVSTAPANYAPADPVNNNTVKRGQQAPRPISAAQTREIETILTTAPPQ